MRHLTFLIFALFGVILTPSCSTTVVPVDGMPADSTITNIELENYINRTYIALLNRKPSDVELTTAVGQLDVDRYDRSIRSTYVLGLQCSLQRNGPLPIPFGQQWTVWTTTIHGDRD